MSEFAIPKGKAPKSSSNRRLKISALNDVLTCPLCHGYFIEPTTINNCFHSFCRSCIVKHLEKYPYSNCPCCRSNKPVNLSHLRSDTQLKSIVYKLVPGLYQSESKRLQQFNDEHKVVLSDHRQKPASHLNSQLINSKFHTPQQQQLLDSTVENNSRRTDERNDISCSGDVKIDDVDFFSADEPISLSLEYHPESIKGHDIQSVPPIRYLQCPAAVTIRHLQRFLSSKYNLNIDLPNVDIQIIYEDEVLPMGFNLMDVAYCYCWRRLQPMRFYYQILITTLNSSSPPSTIKTTTTTTTTSSSHQVSKTFESTMTTNQLSASVDASKSPKENAIQTKSESKDIRPVSSPNPNGTVENSPLDRKAVQFENNKNKSETLTVKEPKSSKTSSWNFKSLRSNDIKCNDFVEVKNDNLKYNRSGTVTASDLLKQQKLKPNNIKDNTTKIIPETVTSSNSNNQCNNDDVFSSMKKQQQQQKQDDARKNEHFKININKKIKEGIGKQYAQKNDINSPNIVVSIPQSRRVSLSDDDFENLSLATLKTANKKTKTVHMKQSISVDESMLSRRSDDNKPDIPKLKIELTNLKAKISLNKSKSVESAIRKSFDSERETIYPNQVDLTEYAKNIGLKPISRDEIEKKSDDSYESGSSHKKRKKSGKHSKEPGSKRRKFHAEISSQEEGKLKVKITGNKVSKHERKNSSTSSSDDNNIASNNASPEIIEDKSQSEKNKLSELRKVRHKSTLKLVNNSVVATSTSTAKDNVEEQPKAQPVDPVNNVTSSTPFQSPSFTFAKPKSALNDVKPKTTSVKTYLSGVKFPTKTTPPPPIRPITNTRLFSPPHVPNYPTFVIPQPKNINNQSGSFPINRPVNPPLKRSYSTDSQQLPKQLKLEPISRKLNIPDLIQATAVRIPQKSIESTVTKQSEPYYNSTMSSTYTHEITTKKPTPILLPPSSISVTKMSDTPKPIENTSFNNRPALEIVRISPTAPTVDQQHNQQMNEKKNQMKAITPKATRPPPPTIPLVKIRNASNMSMNSMAAMQRNMVTNSINSSLKHKNAIAAERKEKPDDTASKLPSASDNIVPLDLSGRTENVLVAERKLPPLSPSSSLTKSVSGTTDSSKLMENVSSKSHDNNNSNMKLKQDKPFDHQNSLPKSNAIKRDTNFQSNNIPQCVSINVDSEKKDNKPLQAKVNPTIETSKSISSLNTAQIITAQRQLMPMPKLNEINKMRTTTVRQQNASVRNIPNPSALAFRNQVMTQKTADKQQTSSTSIPTTSISNPILTINSTSTIHTSITNTSPTISHSTHTAQLTCAPVKPNVSTSTSNATSTSTNAVISVKSTTSSAAIPTATTTKISSLNALPKQTTISKQLNLLSGTTSTNNDVNNAKLIAAKKNLNLEKVAASLRAVASENSSANSKISTVA